MENTTTTKDYVLGGSCHAGSEVLNCALNHEHCHSGSFFMSGRKTRNVLHHDNCTAIDHITGGRCRDTGLCAATHEGCLSGHHYKRTDECTVSYDIKNEELTQYGRCVAKHEEEGGPLDGTDFCAWDKEDCGREYRWESHSEKCDCTLVKTGACQYKHELICAVSKDACDELATFVPVIELMRMKESVDCRLCKPDAKKTAAIDIEVPSTTMTNGSTGTVPTVIVVIAGVIGSALWYARTKKYSRLQKVTDPLDVPAIEFSDNVTTDQQGENDDYSIT